MENAYEIIEHLKRSDGVGVQYVEKDRSSKTVP
jgi:hypothetical protein